MEVKIYINAVLKLSFEIRYEYIGRFILPLGISTMNIEDIEYKIVKYNLNFKEVEILSIYLEDFDQLIGLKSMAEVMIKPQKSTIKS